MSPHKSPNIIKYCVITSTAALVAITVGVFTSNNRGISYLECQTVSDIYLINADLIDQLTSSNDYKNSPIAKATVKSSRKNIERIKKDYKKKGCNALTDLDDL